jgi:hypothetical protein
VTPCLLDRRCIPAIFSSHSVGRFRFAAPGVPASLWDFAIRCSFRHRTSHNTLHTSRDTGSSRVGVMRRSASGGSSASAPSNKSPPAPSPAPKAFRIVCARDRATKRFSVPSTCTFEQFRTACCNSHVRPGYCFCFVEFFLSFYFWFAFFACDLV